jgi:DNA polymerase III epsilon subunit-like protein
MCGPKIIIFDIEIIPDLTACLNQWCRLYDRAAMSANFSSICTIGYKVHGQKKAKTISIWDFPGWENNIYDDSKVLKKFLEEVKDADVLVSHFGDRFDKPHVETRLLMHDLPNLINLKNIDTWKIAKGKLKMSHRTLNDLARLLKCDQKMDHGGWGIWESIVAHTLFQKQYIQKDIMSLKKACRIMDKYCQQDVETLDQVYDKLQHLTNKAPNHNLHKKERGCPTCGDKNHKNHIKLRDYHTPTQSYACYRCPKCKATYRTDTKGNSPRSL